MSFILRFKTLKLDLIGFVANSRSTKEGKLFTYHLVAFLPKELTHETSFSRYPRRRKITIKSASDLILLAPSNFYLHMVIIDLSYISLFALILTHDYLPL